MHSLYILMLIKFAIICMYDLITLLANFLIFHWLFALQRCAIDDDYHSFKVTNEVQRSEFTKSNQFNGVNTTDVANVAKENTITTVDHEENKKVDGANARPPLFDVGQRLSCKWTTGAGPRIGCVRDYPTELQSRALEQVQLSPRVAPGQCFSYGPIPSPRPSSKVRLSPRLSYMGIPSPRTPIAASN